MTNVETRTPARQNHEWLMGHFIRLLAGEEPKSVLDVGCGGGELIRACADHGIRARGLDQAGPKLDELREAGFDVREGTAVDLPLGDDAVDWVTMRHVPHHLEDPRRAFAEALRVAETGLLLAEPWFDSSLASQRGWHAVDGWEKRQDRRAGMFHAEVLSLDDLLALMPDGYGEDYEVDSQRNLRLRYRSVDDFEQRSLGIIADLPDDHAERHALAAIVNDLRASQLSWNGSICVLLRRR